MGHPPGWRWGDELHERVTIRRTERPALLSPSAKTFAEQRGLRGSLSCGWTGELRAESLLSGELGSWTVGEETAGPLPRPLSGPWARPVLAEGECVWL